MSQKCESNIFYRFIILLSDSEEKIVIYQLPLSLRVLEETYPPFQKSQKEENPRLTFSNECDHLELQSRPDIGVLSPQVSQWSSEAVGSTLDQGS